MNLLTYEKCLLAHIKLKLVALQEVSRLLRRIPTEVGYRSRDLGPRLLDPDSVNRGCSQYYIFSETSLGVLIKLCIHHALKNMVLEALVT